jgi:putative sterol carrier protein/NAD(P)H-dependent FMN reductase
MDVQRKLSDTPFTKEIDMSPAFQVVAINGSPHMGIGNTGLMIQMIRQGLEKENISLEEIFLAGKKIEYCQGCAFCLEHARCWIKDDHAGIIDKLSAADAVILGSPVYFFHVTAQMKTFLDRSLAFGHKPRPNWKPGLAVSVSAGMNETPVADYLASTLRVYGAFSVGALTAISVGIGEFWGKPAVEARAADLAGDLANAIKEKRRWPPTDRDLTFWRFMGGLVKDERELMKGDDAHWQKYGLYDSFENYIGQGRTRVEVDHSGREIWIKEMMERQAERVRQERSGEKEKVKAASETVTCRELLGLMPSAFNPAAAEGLKAIYQFEVSGDENFVVHLIIENQQCTFREGPAAKPDVTIKTPAEIWLKISRGQLEGAQAFMSGQYQVEGDLNLLIKLGTLFKKM